MARRGRQQHRYPKLVTRLPPHLLARLQAASTVLRTPVERLVESALESQLEKLEETQLELIDRLAAETIARTERD